MFVDRDSNVVNGNVEVFGDERNDSILDVIDVLGVTGGDSDRLVVDIRR